MTRYNHTLRGDSQIKKSISLQNRCIYIVCIKISCIIAKMLICLEQKTLFPKTSKPLCPTVLHISAPWGFDDVQQDGPLNGIGDKIPENKSPPVRTGGKSWFRNRHPKKMAPKKKVKNHQNKQQLCKLNFPWTIFFEVRNPQGPRIPKHQSHLRREDG